MAISNPDRIRLHVEYLRILFIPQQFDLIKKCPSKCETKPEIPLVLSSKLLLTSTYLIYNVVILTLNVPADRLLGHTKLPSNLIPSG